MPDFMLTQRLPKAYCTRRDRMQKLPVSAHLDHLWRRNMVERNLIDLTDFRMARKAEASLYAEKKAAEAAMTTAEAKYFTQKKEAEGLIEMSKAYGHLSNALGGPQGLLQYLMLQNNTYEKLANANANAIKGLQPKITVWNTGEGAESSNNGTGAIRNIMQSLPPLLSTINEQTGIAPPGWLAQMGQAPQSQAVMNGKDGNYVNGK